MVRSIRGRTAVTAVTAATAGAALLGLAACSNPNSGADSGSSAARGESFTVGVAYEPETLSPLLGYSKDGNSKIFEGLLTHDARMKLVPALARELPKVSDDGRTYSFRLREGVKFSDGRPFTADDVLATYRSILAPKTNNAYRSELDAIKTVEKTGKHSVVFHLKYRYAPFAERTVLPIASAHQVNGQDPNTGSLNTKPIGTGPYLLTGWTKGEKLSFKANPHYWGGAPKVKRLTVAVIEDDDVRATRLRAGDLDGAILPPNLAETYRKEYGKKVINARTADFRGVTLPSANPVTGDPAVRRALNTAVDRKAMVDKIMNGAARPAYSAIPTGSPDFAKGTEQPHDPKAAKKLLDQAGWKPGKDGIRSKDGKRASFTLWYFSGDKLRQDHALAYASDAKKIGISVKVQAGSREVVRPRLKQDAMLMGGGSPADPDFDMYSTFHSSLGGEGWNNMARYDVPAVDKALDTARRSNDPAVRTDAYRAAQRAIARNPGYTFLDHIDHVYVMDDDWKGITTQVEPHDHGLAGPWWDIEDWKPKSSPVPTK